MSSHLVSDGARRWGRFEDRPAVVNPLDAYAGVRRRLRGLRLKEWLGWTLLHPEIACSMILQDAHYLASSELYVRDLAAGSLTRHSRNLRGGSLKLPESLAGSAPAAAARGYRIGYRFGADAHTIDVAIDAAGSQPSVTAHLELDATRASAPLSVSQPLGGEAAMYTHKAAYPVTGQVRVGDRTYTFRPDRDLALLDEHKSFLPRRTSWWWGTFGTITADGIVAANLCQRAAEPGTPGESCLWVPVDGRPACLGLAEPVFTPTSSDPLAPWQVTTPDGRVDVVFTPDGRAMVKHQLVVVSIDYFQLTGTYAGTLVGRDGAGHEVAGVRGVLESMKARM